MSTIPRLLQYDDRGHVLTASAILGGAYCHLGTGVAYVDPKSQQRVVVIADTADDLSAFLRANGIAFDKSSFVPLATMKQRHVKIIEDL